MKPRLMPNSRLRTFAVTESALVVQEPLLTTVCFLGSYRSWLTPMFTVMSSPFPAAPSDGPQRLRADPADRLDPDPFHGPLHDTWFPAAVRLSRGVTRAFDP